MESRPLTAPHRPHSMGCGCWRQRWRWPAEHPIAWGAWHGGATGVSPSLPAPPGQWSRTAASPGAFSLCWCQALQLLPGVPPLLPGSTHAWRASAACVFQQPQGLCSEPGLTLMSLCRLAWSYHLGTAADWELLSQLVPQVGAAGRILPTGPCFCSCSGAVPCWGMGS